MKSCVARLAVLAATGVFAGGINAAQAADLGGDCCADLEERIAELEATTARKGNRKVSLEIYGQVNQAVLWWDDGVESNAGVYTNDASRTRFGFKGKAKIDGEWSAGYKIEIGIRAANSKRFDQDEDSGLEDGSLDLRHSFWYIDNKKLGRVSVGLTSAASESITESNVAQTGSALKYSDIEDNALGLDTLSGGVRQGQSWRRLIGAGGSGTQSGEGNRYNLIRYDTPELAGFTASVNWGEDDNWEVGLRYEGEINVFKIEAGIAYGENIDGDGSGESPGNDCAITDAVGRDADCNYLGGSISVMHTPSGLYGNFAAGRIQDDNVPVGFDDENSFYAFEAGIEKKWISLGKTTFFGQYLKTDGGYLERDWDSLPGDVEQSELESYGLGVVQGIDAASMKLYLLWKRTEGEVSNANGTLQLDELDVVTSGAIIKF